MTVQHLGRMWAQPGAGRPNDLGCPEQHRGRPAGSKNLFAHSYSWYCPFIRVWGEAGSAIDV